MSEFIGEIRARLVKDDSQGMWELLAPLSFKSDLLGKTITAPAGFQTDYCSVPRVPLAYDMLGNRARKSGAIHDWAYSSGELTREQADELLREMLVLNDVSKCEAEQFYLAVRLFGASHYSEKQATSEAA